MTLIKLNTDDPATKAIWDTVCRSRIEVATWPEWKRGYYDWAMCLATNLFTVGYFIRGGW